MSELPSINRRVLWSEHEENILRNEALLIQQVCFPSNASQKIDLCLTTAFTIGSIQFFYMLSNIAREKPSTIPFVADRKEPWGYTTRCIYFYFRYLSFYLRFHFLGTLLPHEEARYSEQKVWRGFSHTDLLSAPFSFNLSSRFCFQLSKGWANHRRYEHCQVSSTPNLSQIAPFWDVILYSHIVLALVDQMEVSVETSKNR